MPPALKKIASKKEALKSSPSPTPEPARTTRSGRKPLIAEKASTPTPPRPNKRQAARSPSPDTEENVRKSIRLRSRYY